MAMPQLMTDTLMVLVYIIISAFVGGVIVAGYVYFQKQFKYKYPAFIFEPTSTGGYQILSDKAGFFVDNKTKNKLFFLKKENHPLSPDKVKFATLNGKKCVFVYKNGMKDYSFIIPEISKTVEGVSKISLKVGDEDVNWSVNTFERNKKLFSNSLLMQLLPYIALAFTGLVIAIIFIYFFKNLSVLKDFGQSLVDASANLAMADQGTTVVAGGG